MSYDPSTIEPKWQAVWRESRAFATPIGDDRPKYYILDMFPYPSGHGLHVGHLKGYVASDVVARYKRMRGFAVLHPMGWDSFGLPAERQADREGIAPSEVTRRNVATFRRQLDLVGLSYDWERELATSDPRFYRWTQWIFLVLLEHGLAYQADVTVNWCPALGTVLANEEVVDGRYVETGDRVEPRVMRQWMLRITAYAERLRDDLDLVDWPEPIKKLQRDWIANLRDWVFSRQRYWGEPIPVVHGPRGEVEAEPDLPLALPPKPTERAAPPLEAAREWVATRLPSTGEPARRETNVMPQWAGSCWYYLRFLDPHDDHEAWSADEERRWMPVDLYVGGSEHAVLHLLYARFWHKVLYDAGLVSTPEPFRRLFNQGKVHASSFRDDRGRYHAPGEVEERDGAWLTRDGEPVTRRVEKMGKSKLNGIAPESLVAEYGADSLRLYEMFMGPLEANVVWQADGISGMRRFLDRVWRLTESAGTDEDDPAVERLLHRTIERVTDDLEALALNTAVSHLMIFVNEATARGGVSRDAMRRFVCALAPFAPHVCEEIWARLGGEGLVVHASWPEVDPAMCVETAVTVVVQVDGKVRARISIAPDEDPTDAAREAVRSWIDGRRVVRTVVVPGRVVNFATEE